MALGAHGNFADENARVWIEGRAVDGPRARVRRLVVSPGTVAAVVVRTTQRAMVAWQAIVASKVDRSTRFGTGEFEERRFRCVMGVALLAALSVRCSSG